MSDLRFLLPIAMYAPPYALPTMQVIFGTVASQYAKSSLLPCLIMPLCSWSVPGRYPGVSTSVTIGMLKESQNRIKRAVLVDELMSRAPARYIGWLATMPTVLPPILAKPTTMFSANNSCTSKKSPLSTMDLIISFMSYCWYGFSGRMLTRLVSILFGSSFVSTIEGSSALFCGRNDSSFFILSKQSYSFLATM